MSDIVWEEPPVRPTAPPTLEQELKERPGQWAKVTQGPKVPSSRLAGDLTRQGFEVDVRGVEDEPGHLKVYARWVEPAS